MAGLKVLISGAGIAGCTLAYWLARNGHSATVVERSGSLRSSGSPVDVRGPAADVAERMNIATRLRDASIRVAGMTFLDSVGRRVARVDLETLRSSIAPKDIELARGDLARILHEASANDAEYIFEDSIKNLTQDDMGVDAVFENSRARRFDLVIGADGLHSIVRRLAFGADAEFVRHAGLYVATLPLPGNADAGREMFMLNTPGKLAALHPSRKIPLAYFVFWHQEITEFDYTDLDQHKRILERAFAGIGWRVPEFLIAVRAANDMYFRLSRPRGRSQLGTGPDRASRRRVVLRVVVRRWIHTRHGWSVSTRHCFDGEPNRPPRRLPPLPSSPRKARRLEAEEPSPCRIPHRSQNGNRNLAQHASVLENLGGGRHRHAHGPETAQTVEDFRSSKSQVWVWAASSGNYLAGRIRTASLAN